MKAFDSLLIRDKLIRIIVTITAVVFVPAAILIVIVDFLLLCQVTAHNLTVLGDAIAYNSSAALAFENEEEAGRVLQSLQTEKNITQAIIFTLTGQAFAVYRPEAEVEQELPEGFTGWDFFRGEEVRHVAAIYEGETQLGWLMIRYDLAHLQQRLFYYLLFALILTGAALLGAWFLSRKVQERISGPIVALEDVIRKIATSHDYGKRAVKTTDDEIGSLTTAFNEMLEEIAGKEEARRISEERLRAAVEAAHAGVWDRNLETGTGVWLGSIFDDLPALRNQPDLILNAVHPEDRPLLEQRLKKAAEGKEPFEADFRIYTKTGEIRYLRSRGRTLTNDQGKAVRMIGSIMDITDLYLAQAEISVLNENLESRVHERTLELQRALSEIESFNYSVSHDLRTPLRAINGFSQALLDDYHDTLDETAQDFLQRIVSSCQRMGLLIDDLLKLSRLTKQEMNKEPLDLTAIAREIVRDLRAEEPNRKVEVEIEEELHSVGDPRLLTVALENLLQNAWKFTGKTPHPRIEVGRIQEKDRQVFFVRDNGAGFDMAYSSALFGVFQRLHRTSEFEGTGIGLATVRRIIERHGGEVWATSHLDKGAVFYFSIPS